MDTEEIRDRLRDYYGTAIFSGLPMAAADMLQVDGMTGEELLEKAEEMGWDTD